MLSIAFHRKKQISNITHTVQDKLLIHMATEMIKIHVFRAKEF